MSFWAPWTHLDGYSLQPGAWIPVFVVAFLGHGVDAGSRTLPARSSISAGSRTPQGLVSSGVTG